MAVGVVAERELVRQRPARSGAGEVGLRKAPSDPSSGDVSRPPGVPSSVEGRRN